MSKNSLFYIIEFFHILWYIVKAKQQSYNPKLAFIRFVFCVQEWTFRSDTKGVFGHRLLFCRIGCPFLFLGTLTNY